MKLTNNIVRKKIYSDLSSVGLVVKRLNNERRVDHHVASSIMGSDTLLCLHRSAWGDISVAKWNWQ